MHLKNSKLDKSRFFPEVLQVVPTDDYKVYAYMNDGSVHLYDAKALLNGDGTNSKLLRNIDFFKNKITVIGHSIAWDTTGDRDEYKCIDVDPFDVFNSPVIEDPLETQNRS